MSTTLRNNVKPQTYTRGIIQTTFIIFLVFISFEYISSRYEILIAPDEGPICLPEKVFILDKMSFPEKDGFVMFTAKGLEPWFTDGMPVVKYLRGSPGDEIKVMERRLYINGVQRATLNDTVLEKLKVTDMELERNEVIPDNKYWVMGSLPPSLDSRYWGYITKSQIIGKAYAIF